MLRNSGHHHNVSRGALKVQGVRSIVADRYTTPLAPITWGITFRTSAMCVTSICVRACCDDVGGVWHVAAVGLRLWRSCCDVPALA